MTGANAARVTAATRSCSASHRRAAPPAWARAGAAGSSPARTATSVASGGLNPRTDTTSEAASGSSEDDSTAASACAPRLAGEGRRLAAGAGGGEVDARPAGVDRAQDGGGPGRAADGEGDLLGGGLRYPHDPRSDQRGHVPGDGGQHDAVERCHQARHSRFTI